MSAFIKGILSNFVSKSLVAGIGLITVIMVSRYLGPQGRGQIGLFMSSVALVQLFCDFGNSSAIINLSYKYNQRVLWLSSIQWIAAVCIISFPILYFFKDLPFWFLVAPAAFLYSLINLHHLLLMGNQEVHKRNVSILIVPAILMSLFFVLCLLTPKQEGNYVLALFTALFISAVISYQLIRSKLRFTDSVFQFEPAILKQGVWVQSAQAVQFFNYRLNFFLVAYFLGDASLGVYNNAVILGESIWILGHSIAQIQHMKILNTIGESNHFRITQKSMMANFAGTCLMLAVLIALPIEFWTLLFGDGFEDIRPMFITLSVGILAFSISNIINHGLHAANRFKTILICNSLGLMFGLTLALILIPKYQLHGAALSWSGGLLIAMFAYMGYYFKMNKAHLDMKIAVIAMIISVCAAFLMFVLSNGISMERIITENSQRIAARASLALCIFFVFYFLVFEIWGKFKKSRIVQ